MQKASLYFHLPFCSKKCPYCHFYVLPNKENLHDLLEEALFLEWEEKLPLLKDHQILSIYFGGGTPTLYPLTKFQKLLHRIKQDLPHLAPNLEITIEANPENGSEKFYESLLNIGFNRISIGVQSFDDRSLQSIERVHSAKLAENAIIAAHKAGFTNISIDLMYDLPNQTQASWQYSLDKIPQLPIQHLSLYNLTIEPHTAFFKRRKSLQFPDDLSSLSLLQSAIKALLQAGFDRYEISAFAKLHHTSIHNTGYWTGRPFLGFGPSASSYWRKKRFRNLANIHRYSRALKQKECYTELMESLSEEASQKELFCLQLRTMEGATLHPNFSKEFLYTLESLIQKQLIQKSGDKIQLTDKGLLFHDLIASELI